MPFTPPKASTYKQFVILDYDGVLAALSALDGGQVDEILMQTAEERGREGGGELGAGPARVKGKGGRTRRVEEKMRLARTRHSTAAKLLDKLHSDEAIGLVDGPLDMEVGRELEAGMVLQFRARLTLHPLHQADRMLRSFIKVAPKFGEKQAASELRSVLQAWGALVGTDQQHARILLQPETHRPQVPRLLVPVPIEQFELDLDEVLGEVTVVAQVERVLAEGEDHPAIRFLRGAPTSGVERSALEEALPELVAGLKEMGVEIGRDDLYVPGPALALRAICAHR